MSELELPKKLEVCGDILKSSGYRLNRRIKDYLFIPDMNPMNNYFEFGFFIQNIPRCESKSFTMNCDNECTIFEFRFLFIKLLGNILEEYKNISIEIIKEAEIQELELKIS